MTKEQLLNLEAMVVDMAHSKWMDDGDRLEFAKLALKIHEEIKSSQCEDWSSLNAVS